MTRKKGDGRKQPAVDVADSVAIDTQAVAEFVSRFDEAAKRRLDNLNQKLVDLERQMAALEAEMKRAQDSTVFDFDDYYADKSFMYDQIPKSFLS